MTNFQQEILYDSRKKNVFIAYLLGALLASVGLHRFYLGDNVGGLVYVVLFFFGMFVPVLYVITCILFVFDLFYTYHLCKEYNIKVRRTIEAMEE
ncbi:transmembrane domain protein [Alteromonas phage vB_AmeM_PT11-V22]|uniref:Transmembrane domain protein n=1 Tax=Alteromonas phage vB_AmeM_PT11-V22 TaxID=2704031 RepID=A0A6C0R0L7_9CAUD|nr:transmembrane domain protein [Alteromonas phage vB_AmeM_PT11-V22]QHZ59831.1 transmembrane domain protein [Alteromonas phage vB_AmeM_PT11-V22]